MENMRYMDKALPVETRTEELLKLMTPDEKIGQIVQLFGWKVYARKQGGGIRLEDAFCEEVRRRGVGSLYGTLRADPWTGVTLAEGLSPREGAEAVNEIQRFAIEASRLGIPILIGEECSHGHMAIGATVFPVPLLAGSAWNTELYERMSRAVALETWAQGGRVTYSPVLDVVRDPRWGRTEECYGEDAYLAGELAVAAVRGMQGQALDAPGSIGVTLKHFVAYGSSEGGRNGAPVHMGMRELHEVDLYPFRKAVEAGALSLMPAYNEIDGVPCTSNVHLMKEVVREQWGFDGFVISDCGAIAMLAGNHGVARDELEAGAMALKAGVDMEMSGTVYTRMDEALRRGDLDMADLDEAVSRILTAKFKLGLFEQPYSDPDKAELVIRSEEHRELAREAAAEGIVLLKNEKATLPLEKSALKRIAVIGPNADNGQNQLGDYTSPQKREQLSTVLDGIRGKLAHTGAEVLYAPGCAVRDESREGFAHAAACAAEADVTVLVLGGSSARDFGEGTVDLRTGASVIDVNRLSDMDCGEGFDRAELGLSGVQLELAQEIRKQGKKVIVVYINGRPIVEPWIDEHADAILEAWYPGGEGGAAIADLLFGDANPSGKLTLTLPKHAGQVPLQYNLRRTKGKRYLETDLSPRYPFGYGLSYTEFRYADIRLDSDSITTDGEARVSIDVTNIGQRAGAEVVQLYVSDLVSSYTRPEKELKGFRKIRLEPGETRTVTFSLSKDELAVTSPNGQLTVEPGAFRIGIGGSSAVLTETMLNVLSGKEA